MKLLRQYLFGLIVAPVLIGCVSQKPATSSISPAANILAPDSFLLLKDGSIHSNRDGVPTGDFVAGTSFVDRAGRKRFKLSSTVVVQRSPMREFTCSAEMAEPLASRFLAGIGAKAGPANEAIKEMVFKSVKILFELDNQTPPHIAGRAQCFDSYIAYAHAYYQVVWEQKLAYEQASTDPVLLRRWPIDGEKYQDDINFAWNNWVSLGFKNQIDQALAALSAALPAENSARSQSQLGWMDLSTGAFYPDQNAKAPEKPYIKGYKDELGKFVTVAGIVN